MVGSSQVIQTIAAMMVFSLILLNANRMIQRNTIMQIEGELEKDIIALAQDIVNESQTKEFDEESVGFVPLKIPDNFTGTPNLGPDSGESDRTDYDDFDDYNGYSTTVDDESGNTMYEINVSVYYVEEGTYDSTANRTTFKKIDVTLTSPYLTETASNNKINYTFEFIRNFYAD